MAYRSFNKTITLDKVNWCTVWFVCEDALPEYIIHEVFSLLLHMRLGRNTRRALNLITVGSLQPALHEELVTDE